MRPSAFPLWCAVLLTAAGPAAAMDLVRDGQPAATLVIPDEPLPVVTYAAGELTHHVRRASGAELAVVPEAAAPAEGPRVFLGATKAAAEAGLDLAALPPNGFIIRLVGDRFFLAGDDGEGEPGWIQHNNRTRVGTLFAVYEFLERGLGCRWLWPGELGEVIPAHADITVQAWDETGAPAFIHARWRDGGAYAGQLAGWASPAARGKFLSDQGRWLRRNRFAMAYNMDMAHAFTRWWERHAEAHPDFFNLLPDGTRRSDPTYHRGSPTLISMCVSEPAFHRAVVEDWVARRSPMRPHLDASENDTCGKCTCERCLAWDEPDPELDFPWAERLDRAREAFEAGEPGWCRLLGSLSDRYARFLLALQEEARKVDPDVVVMGYAYANYVRPPLDTRLNENVIIGAVPPGWFPWTAEKRAANREIWEGWRAAGARLFLRPNWMLDGHNLPLNWARALGEEFRYHAHNGMIGTDFDSLTGQYATQGPTLYMLARLHARPDLTVDEVLEEYFGAFGPAAEAVRAYFDHWEALNETVTERPADLHWSFFYRNAHLIFTPEVMAAGRALLDRAAEAAAGDDLAARRVAFLDAGLRNVELTLAAQAAYRGYRNGGDIAVYRRAVEALDAFRAQVETDNIANMAYLAWAEVRTWQRELLRLMAQPGERLPGPWKFMWDPDEQGEAQGWFADDFDDRDWLDIATDGPWEEQPVGRQWREEHGADYDGIAWYRTRFAPARDDDRPQVRLVFGAVDEACVVWVNGRRLLERPYPYRGNPDSWQEAFEVDITDVVRYDRPNTVAVQVEDRAGAGGIWRMVWLVQSAPPAPETDNAVNDGGFEEGGAAWQRNVMGGAFNFAIDDTVARSGRVSGRLQCTALAPDETQRQHGARSWGRWFQTGIPVQEGRKYRLRLWVRTDAAFTGRLAIWVRGTAAEGEYDAAALNTGGHWIQLSVPDIVPAGDRLALYLNLMDGTGTAWFDDVELVAQDD